MTDLGYFGPDSVTWRIQSEPMAMVGGVSLLLAPQSYIGFCAASMLSPKGRCHAFDARADGYVRAEGGGLVILKPLGQALEQAQEGLMKDPRTSHPFYWAAFIILGDGAKPLVGGNPQNIAEAAPQARIAAR